MYKLFFYCIPIFVGFSCSNILENNDKEITKSAKKYTEDYYFKNNLNVEFIDFNLNKLEKLNSSEMDSIIVRMIKNEIIKITFRIGNYNIQDMSSAISDPNFKKNAEIAGNSFELKSYSDSLKIYMNKPGFIAHFYSKYKLFDQENNFLNNKLYQDRTYLISDNYKVIRLIN